MYDIILDALVDSLKMVPFLLFIYIGIEVLEFRYSNKIGKTIKNVGKGGPILGALFGCIPQCGFSVVTTALYSQRIVTMGTLLAVYLSTSDEAIPIILAQPDKLGVLFPLIATKIVLAILAGLSIDAVIKSAPHKTAKTEVSATTDVQSKKTKEEVAKGCCGHNCTNKNLDLKQLIVHPLIHTFRVLLFIFGVSVLINFIIAKIGIENLSNAFMKNSIWQPIIAGLIGLIPNCASSVAITEVFLKGGISFGSTIAGLSSSAGLGLIVLFKENIDFRDSLKVVSLLFGISVLAGIIIQFFYG